MQPKKFSWHQRANIQPATSGLFKRRAVVMMAVWCPVWVKRRTSSTGIEASPADNTVGRGSVRGGDLSAGAPRGAARPQRRAPGALTMIALQSVTKQFQHRGKAVMALAGVSLEIAKGDFIAVIGPSGSGKSTLLHLLGGMLSPTAGKVRFGSDSLYDLSSDERSAIRKHKIDFVFQTFNLVPYLTALENVQVPLVLAGVGEEEQKRRAESLLGRVGLSDRLDHKPRELSVGEQQRVALARMLANDPVLILADEPTGNLDPETADSIMDFLIELNREGRTIVLVTHDLRVAGRAKRILRLVKGAIQPDAQVGSQPEAGPLVEEQSILKR